MRAALQDIFTKEIGIKSEYFVDDLTYNSIPEWDSASHMSIILAIEERFGVTLESDDIVAMTSVRKIIRVLEDKGVAVG